MDIYDHHRTWLMGISHLFYLREVLVLGDVFIYYLRLCVLNKKGSQAIAA